MLTSRARSLFPAWTDPADGQTLQAPDAQRAADMARPGDPLPRSRKMPTDKRTLYRTARATISCALFRAGDIVSVRFDRTDWQGTDWYEITGFASRIFYPAHHLTAFCL